MSDIETTTTTSANGTWDLRYTNTFVVSSAGYGNGAWLVELVERATGRVVRSWSGSATTSPWDASSTGTRSVSWEGDLLVVVENDETEVRVAPEELGAP